MIELGELERNHVDSQDVTQEYYDIDARIKNKQQEEKRLQKHLDESTGKLTDILAVERELHARPRRDRADARPDPLPHERLGAEHGDDHCDRDQELHPARRATFAAQISRTFSNSVENLVRFGRTVVLAAVAITPWLPILIVVALMLLWLGRRLRRADAACCRWKGSERGLAPDDWPSHFAGVVDRRHDVFQRRSRGGGRRSSAGGPRREVQSDRQGIC